MATKIAADLKVGDAYWTGANQWLVEEIVVNAKTVEVLAIINAGFVGYGPDTYRKNLHRLNTKFEVTRP